MSVKLRSGARIPLMGLGTYQLKKEAAENAVMWAIRAGYRLIDTARVYRNEKYIGRGIKRAGVSRKDLWITSKVPPNEQGEERAYAAVLDSLVNLETDYIDLVLIHWPGTAKIPLDSPANRESRQGTWNALVRLQAEGKVRHIGTSNFLSGT